MRKNLKKDLTNAIHSVIMQKLSEKNANVAQLVEQLIRNQQVAGPSPAISSKTKIPDQGIFCFGSFHFSLFSLHSSLKLSFPDKREENR